MDARKILEVINIYRNLFIEKGIEAKDFPHTDKPDSPEEIFAHCRGMISKMKTFIKEGRTGKVFRWLGFIQGCLWATRQYSLEDLKNHNRPKE